MYRIASFICLMSLVCGSVAASADDASVAQLIEWPQNSSCSAGRCGYIPANKMVTESPKLHPTIKLRAKKPAQFLKTGEAVIEGGIEILQPGRSLTAERIKLQRDLTEGKIRNIDLQKNVKFRENDKLLLAQRGRLNFVEHSYHLQQVIYRLILKTSRSWYGFVWGKAQAAYNDKEGVLHFDKGTYSSCDPETCSWWINCRHLAVDRQHDQLTMKHATFWIRKVPIFYLPYLSISLEKKRCSGFLTPYVRHSSYGSYSIATPYYWMLAPNYDLLITPEIFSNSGVLFKNHFRYLTTQHRGDVHFNYVVHDAAFHKFCNGTYESADPMALKHLRHNHDFRANVSWHERAELLPNLIFRLRGNYSTDDYFLRHYSLQHSQDIDQLVSDASLEYFTNDWRIQGRIMGTQTLHQVQQNRVQDQYMRLPQLNLQSSAFDLGGGVNYRIQSELVNFHYPSWNDRTSIAILDAVRFNSKHAIAKNFYLRGLRVTPALELCGVHYTIPRYNRDITMAQENRFTRITPIFTVDQQMRFNRSIHVGKKGLVQTLEPRLMYLYVPAPQQHYLPIFDTYLPVFDYDQLFRKNRFAGVDRVGDAHQLAGGITTRLLDEAGDERLNAGVGAILAFKRHHCKLDRQVNIDPLQHQMISPLVGSVQYSFNSYASGTLKATWDPRSAKFNSTSIEFQLKQNQHIFNIWYHYAVALDQFMENRTVSLNRVGCSFAYKINEQWRLFSNLTYNLSYRRLHDYFAGIEYRGGCWALRCAMQRNFVAKVNNQSSFDTNYYVQIVFKGFSAADIGDMTDILRDKIKGFHNEL